MVPYLRNDGARHDFSHTIHHFAFEDDDDHNVWKARDSRLLKKKVGIDENPLDGTEARVGHFIIRMISLS